MVLKSTEKAPAHRAARYEPLPAALDALVDPARLEAFEAHPPRATHPYQHWRHWRATQMASSEGTDAVGVSSFPQAPADESFGESDLPKLRRLG